MGEVKWKEKEGLPKVTQQAAGGVNGGSGGLLCFYPSKIRSLSTAPDVCSDHPCRGPGRDTGSGIK